MHGEAKLRTEGYRTRDGHVLEWIERLRPGLAVTVRSRPEPFPRVAWARRRGRVNPAWNWQSPEAFDLPTLRARRRWWVDSLQHEPTEPVRSRAMIAWNPIAAAALIGTVLKPENFVMDLLDDWSVHVAFRPIREEVEAAYVRVFDAATAVTANSEGTMALAARFGRNADLITNGCDPEYFATAGDQRSGDGTSVVGYVGKLSERLDVDLIREVAERLPSVRFDIAGPFTVASRETIRQIKSLNRLPNVRLGGNVSYEELPDVIATWDLGWVPHRTGKFEVGGDVIKTYEYRAAGLPVIATPIIGSDRITALSGVTIARDADDATVAIRGILEATGGHPPRIPATFEAGVSWREKTEAILKHLGL